MKLKSRFSIIAAICGLEMIVLAFLTMVGANFIQKMQNFQFHQQECQFAVADVINYLNQTIHWATDTKTVSNDWKKKIVTANKKFHELAEDSVIKFFPEDFHESVDKTNKIWLKVVSLVNPFNAQLQALQEVTLSEEEHRYIARYGIKSGAEQFPDSEPVQSLLDRTLFIESQMRDLIKNGNDLQVEMTVMYEMLVGLVSRYTVIYRIAIFILGIIFFLIVFVSILRGTQTTVDNIKKVRDMTSALASKDFTTEIKPQGSNEMQALMGNMNGMINEINKFFIIVKKTAAKAISSGYSINDSSTSTAAATTQINANVESITNEFEMINESVNRAVNAINQISLQVKTLVSDNGSQTVAIDDSSAAVSAMANAIVQIRENAVNRSKVAEEMRELVADGDSKISATNNILDQVMGQLDEIREVVTIINSVSARTNLLSMNAAIESAHAGEFGKGFAVVAEEIRSLATSTASNAKKITETVTRTIESVTDANQSSQLASKAFAKVSSHSAEMIDSFAEITKEIENINSQTYQITQKTDITAATAEKINEYCENLAKEQETVASEISAISDLFAKAVEEIHEIRCGTEDIVKRMDAVGSLSKESYKNMTDLENVLEEFKTTSDNQDEVQEEIDDAAIENIISPELQAQLEADFGGNSSDIDSMLEEFESENQFESDSESNAENKNEQLTQDLNSDSKPNVNADLENDAEPKLNGEIAEDMFNSTK